MVVVGGGVRALAGSGVFFSGACGRWAEAGISYLGNTVTGQKRSALRRACLLAFRAIEEGGGLVRVVPKIRN